MKSYSLILLAVAYLKHS